MSLEQDRTDSLAKVVGEALLKRRFLLTTAESCTGGWLGQAVTAIAGSSTWYERGFITYSNSSKNEMLQVNLPLLECHGAVSVQVARAMALGALKNSHADIGVAITGIAGPTGGSDEKPVGTVCFAWALRSGNAMQKQMFFDGDRETIRRQAVGVALQGILQMLDELPISAS